MTKQCDMWMTLRPVLLQTEHDQSKAYKDKSTSWVVACSVIKILVTQTGGL